MIPVVPIVAIIVYLNCAYIRQDYKTIANSVVENGNSISSVFGWDIKLLSQ